MKVSQRLICPLGQREEIHRADLGPRKLRDHKLPLAWLEARERLAARPFDDTQTIGQAFDRAITKLSNKVSRDTRKLRGVPCLAGTRIPLYQICGMIAEGMSVKRVAQTLSMSEDQVKIALRFASIVLEQ